VAGGLGPSLVDEELDLVDLDLGGRGLAGEAIGEVGDGVQAERRRGRRLGCSVDRGAGGGRRRRGGRSGVAEAGNLSPPAS
jgi:hypothetical protein